MFDSVMLLVIFVGGLFVGFLAGLYIMGRRWVDDAYATVELQARLIERQREIIAEQQKFAKFVLNNPAIADEWRELTKIQEGVDDNGGQNDSPLGF